MSKNSINVPYQKLAHLVKCEVIVLEILDVISKYYSNGATDMIPQLVEDAFKKANYPEIPRDQGFINDLQRAIEGADRDLVVLEQKMVSSLIDEAIGSNDPAKMLEAIIASVGGTGKASCGDPKCPSCGNQDKDTPTAANTSKSEPEVKASTGASPVAKAYDSSTPLTNEEINTLAQTKTAEEWSEVSAKIANRRQGNLPPDWIQKVIAGGVVADAAKRWSENATTKSQ